MLLAAGVGLIGWFVARQLRAADPLIHLRLFADRGFTGDAVVMGLVQFGLLGIVLYSSIYLQELLGFGPMAAGLAALPLILPLTLAAQVGGRWFDRAGVRPPVLAGLAVCTAGIVAWLLALPALTYAWQIPGMVLVGVGLGLTLSPTNTDALGRVPDAERSQASGVVQTVRQLGGTLGVAVIGGVVLDRRATPCPGRTGTADAIAPGFGVAAVAFALAVALGALLLAERRTERTRPDLSPPRPPTHNAEERGLWGEGPIVVRTIHARRSPLPRSRSDRRRVVGRGPRAGRGDPGPVAVPLTDRRRSPGRVHELVDAVWGDRATARSVSTLESHLHRLRRFLEPGRGRVRRRAAEGRVRRLSARRRRRPDRLGEFAGLARASCEALAAGDAGHATARASRPARSGEVGPTRRGATSRGRRPGRALEELTGSPTDTLVGALLADAHPERALVELEPVLAAGRCASGRGSTHARRRAAGRTEDALATYRRADRPRSATSWASSPAPSCAACTSSSSRGACRRPPHDPAVAVGDAAATRGDAGGPPATSPLAPDRTRRRAGRARAPASRPAPRSRSSAEPVAGRPPSR